ncbi:MAG: DHHW family protein [bacterium]|nr:DHHW family protein [bacterium]MCM1374241.1 DHHW family protein [Muribaculum sp.]
MITNVMIRKTLVCLLCIGILSLSTYLVLSPKRGYSENENRYLAELPELSPETVLNGEFMDSLGDWLADHFPQRDFFVGLKSGVEIASGRKCINHIYMAEDDYLIEPYDNPQNTERITDTLARFYDKISEDGIHINLMLVPTAVTIYRDKLPAYAPSSDQLETAYAIYDATGIPAIDCTQRLLDGASQGQLYYRTDHHWTTFGAYQGYLAYCDAKGFTPLPLESLTARTVTEEFAGTLYSKINDYDHKRDEITIYTNPQDTLTVTYLDTGEVTDSLYNLDYLEEKDKYSLFLNNIHPLIVIENTTAASQDELMLIKDSYANSMAAFLAHHFRKIYVFDTRYYRDGPSSFLAEHDTITDVLLLYNLNTLDSDTGIRGIY